MEATPLWTVLTSEFTHFNLVIRLSKVKQLAFGYAPFLQSPADPALPWKPWWKIVFSEWSQSEQPENSFCVAAAFILLLLVVYMSMTPVIYTDVARG